MPRNHSPTLVKLSKAGGERPPYTSAAMGNEATCRITANGKKFEAKVLLETEELVIRGDERRKIRFADVKEAAASAGTLKLVTSEGIFTFTLGDDAAKWLKKITHPKSRSEKLGIKRDMTILLINMNDDALREELERAGANIIAKPNKPVDAIFVGANTAHDLSKLSSLLKQLAPAGSLWVIRPKGVAAITETMTLHAGRAAGLKDVKVVKFSETHTAEKFVRPLSSR